MSCLEEPARQAGSSSSQNNVCYFFVTNFLLLLSRLFSFFPKTLRIFFAPQIFLFEASLPISVCVCVSEALSLP